MVLHYISMQFAWKAKLKVKIPTTYACIDEAWVEWHLPSWLEHGAYHTEVVCSIPVLASHLTLGLVGLFNSEYSVFLWVHYLASFKTSFVWWAVWISQPQTGRGSASSSPGSLSSRFWKKVDVGSLLCCLEGLELVHLSTFLICLLCQSPDHLWMCITGAVGPGPAYEELN